MIIQSAEFQKSCPSLASCPETSLPEYAFIGRSNVGKSSLINMLVGRRSLALTSRKPGKTQLINYFLINGNWHLVDLPGYGYARQSKDTRERWEKMIKGYLQGREELMMVFILVDARIEAQASDLEIMEWMAEKEIPFIILFTKSDKLSQGQQVHHMRTYAAALQEQWEELPLAIYTSSLTGKGKDAILQFIADTNATLDPGYQDKDPG